MADDLSPTLLRFIRDHVGAIEQLEVLLLLHRDVSATAGWTSEAVAAELRTQPRSVDMRLAALLKSGLITRVEDAPRFRLNIDSPSCKLVDELAAAYQSHRVRVVEAIFSRPADNIRVFADAFVIGKKPNG